MTTGRLPKDFVSAAREAGLIYVSDAAPGITRLAAGKGFRYIYPGGNAVADEEVLSRIRSLVIPPAWESVWISSRANGHLQVTGRDARGRKQYRYHPRFRSERELSKYGEMVVFGAALPTIRRQVKRDLSMRELSRSRVVAAVVNLLDLTSMRVGNAEYARENNSFGLTTLRNRHASVKGSAIRLSFKGKSGKTHNLQLNDRRVAKVLKRCHDLPGYELFQYIAEDGVTHPIDSAMVNEYLREVSGRDITAKHFRTWHGTVQAAIELTRCGIGESQSAIKKNVVQAVKAVVSHLGNLPSTCRKYYIHPAILDAYPSGALADAMASTAGSASARYMTVAEQRVLRFLRRVQSKSHQRRLSRKTSLSNSDATSVFCADRHRRTA